jgi:hypothetical protein
LVLCCDFFSSTYASTESVKTDKSEKSKSELYYSPLPRGILGNWPPEGKGQEMTLFLKVALVRCSSLPDTNRQPRSRLFDGCTDTWSSSKVICKKRAQSGLQILRAGKLKHGVTSSILSNIFNGIYFLFFLFSLLFFSFFFCKLLLTLSPPAVKTQCLS